MLRRPFQRALVLWLAIASLAGALTAAEPTPKAIAEQSFRVTRWTTDDGLPQNRISCLKQTRDGYLWIGTWFGLARFDGARFTVFDKFNTPELVSDTINALAEDTDGTLWIATADGLVSYADHHFLRPAVAKEIPHSRVWRLAASAAGGVWVLAGDDFIAQIVGGKISRKWKLQLREGDGIRSIQESPEGLFHVVTGFDWLTLSSPKDEQLTPQFTNSTLSSWLAGWPARQAGCFWLGTQNGLQRRDHSSWRTLDLGELGRRPVDFLHEDRAGGLWVNTKPGGLFRVDQARGTAVDLKDHAAPDSTLCLEEDREGNFWLGTDQGLVQLQTRRVRAYTTRDGLADDNIWSVCEGTDGTIWVGGNRELSRIQNGRVVPLKGPEVLSDQPNRCVWPAPGGGVLTAKPGIGVFEFGEKLTQLVAVSALPDPNIFALYEDRSGRLWIGTGNGVAALQDGQVTAAYTNWAGRSGYNVRCILEDRAGGFWFGTQGQGPTRLRDGQFEVFNERDGLCNNHVWSIHEDGDGVLWLGTENGLNRFVPPGGKLGVPASAGGASPSATPSSSGEFQPAKAGTPNAGRGRFCSFTRKEGLLENAVNWILEDEFGYLWLSGLRGIYRVKREQLNAVAEGRARSVQVAAFGTADSMESSETNGENQPAGWKARDGRLWFPTTRGVVVIDPKTIEVSEVPPPVVIEQVRAHEQVVYGDPVSATDPLPGHTGGNSARRSPVLETTSAGMPLLRLAPGSAPLLEIFYTANSFVGPRRIRFKYRLEGYDAEWRQALNQRTARYTNLRPGRYRFQVQACNSDGVWNERGDQFAFILEPHFYETRTFYVLAAFAVILLGVGIQAYRLRLQRRFLMLEQQAALARERARIAQDMHDDLGSSLTKISILSEIAKKDLDNRSRAETDVEQISATARTVVDNISELVWATNPGNDTLDNLAAYLREFTAHYFETAAIRCRLDFPEAVPPLPVTAELRRGLFLVAKEALNNIVKHSGATEVTMKLELKRSTAHAQPVTAEEKVGTQAAPPKDVIGIEIAITDNGRGFDPGTVSRFRNGLQNMRRRVGALGGTFDLQSKPGRGSEINMRIPLTAAP